MNTLKQKAKAFFTSLGEKMTVPRFKKLLASRAFLVSGCVVLIVAAVAVSALVGGGGSVDGAVEESESGKLLGNSVLVGDAVSGVGEQSDDEQQAVEEVDPSDLLAVTVLNRETVREDAMAVLQEIADNPDALPDEKENALSQISQILDDMEAEVNIETLAAARGIPKCVAVISGMQCSIIVDSSEISESELSQICEIVYEQSGISPAGTKVILADTQRED